MNHQHRQIGIEFQTPQGSYYSFESLLDTERKIELTFLNIKALSSMNHATAINLSNDINHHTQSEYMRFNKTVLKNWLSADLNSIESLCLNEENALTELKETVLLLAPFIPVSYR